MISLNDLVSIIFYVNAYLCVRTQFWLASMDVVTLLLMLFRKFRCLVLTACKYNKIYEHKPSKSSKDCSAGILKVLSVPCQSHGKKACAVYIYVLSCVNAIMYGQSRLPKCFIGSCQSLAHTDNTFNYNAVYTLVFSFTCMTRYRMPNYSEIQLDVNMHNTLYYSYSIIH